MGHLRLHGRQQLASLELAAVASQPAAEGQSAPSPTPAPETATPAADANVATLPDPGPAGDGMTVVAPPYAAVAEMAGPTSSPAVPAGTLHNFTMSSADSQIFTGRDPWLTQPAAFTRQVWLWVPDQYVPGSKAPFIVAQDGGGHLNLANALARLIAADKLPPMLGVFINPGPGDGPGSQRGLEYDTVSAAYVTFVDTEVLPLLRSKYSVDFTDDPEGRATYGGSSGGSAAFTMAWFRPDLYRRVLTWSGTFVNQHPDPTSAPLGAWSYHDNMIGESPARGLRVFLEVGENDNGWGDGTHSWLVANHRMQVALRAKGEHTRLLYARSAGHVDGNVIGAHLPAALLWLWRGYPGVTAD